MNMAINQEWVQLTDNSKRRIAQILDGSMLVEMAFEHSVDENSAIATHKHFHEQITYIKKGTFKFLIIHENGEQEERIVNEGDTLALRSNVEHGCIPLAENSIFMDFFNPIRVDLL